MKKIDFNKIYNKNCLEGMKLIDKNKIDLIITDPPFAIDFKAKKANYNRKSSRVIEGYNEILPENYSQFSYDWISEANRILKESGSMYIFSGWNNLKDIFIDFDAFFATFGLRDPSGWLRGEILLRNGGLGLQIGGVRPSKILVRRHLNGSLGPKLPY